MKKPKYHLESGFSLLEVLSAILIVTFFTAAAMQMMVISAAFKAKAKEYTTAANLIEKDLETVRNIAAQYEFPIVASPVPTLGATAITLSSGKGLKQDDKIQFSGSSNVYSITAPSPIPSASPTIIITPGIISPAPSASTRVGSNTVCSATSASTGLANYLQQITQGSAYIDSSKTFSITEGGASVIYGAVVGANPYIIPDTSKKLWLMRNDNNLNAAPYNVLQVRYLVVKDKNGSPSSNKIVAKLASEVIPNASFQCIQ
jgi:type II secretory pathway pseudopilin PulG